MKTKILVPVLIASLLLLTGLLLAACGSTAQPSPAANSGAPLTGQALLEERCTVCHNTNRITTASGDAAEWKEIVDDMIRRGATLSTAEAQTLVDYLSQTYP